MVGKNLRGLIMMSGLAAAIGSASADPVKRTAVDLLFESKHLELLGKGVEATYRLDRTVTDANLVGEPFSDDIKVAVKDVDAGGKREVVVRLFSGERARDPHTETDLTGNPLLVVFLDRSVSNFGLVGGGNRNYLKQQFRDALRDKADVQPAKVEFDGKTVDGYRITVTPFLGDKNAQKMLGYEGSKFAFLISDAVPGYFVELHAGFVSSVKDAPKFEERIKLVGTGAMK
ncbi:MAG: hypothetical protein ABL908_09640 [Hyphomicrobium sp.]